MSSIHIYLVYVPYFQVPCHAAQAGFLHMVQNGDLDCSHNLSFNPLFADFSEAMRARWLDAAMKEISRWLLLGGADDFCVGTFGSIWADKVLAGRTTRIGLICRSESKWQRASGGPWTLYLDPFSD